MLILMGLFIETPVVDVGKKTLLPMKWAMQVLLVWPESTNVKSRVFNWILLCNLLVAEVFHVAYSVVFLKDIQKSTAASTTVTTTFEVSTMGVNTFSDIVTWHIL